MTDRSQIQCGDIHQQTNDVEPVRDKNASANNLVTISSEGIFEVTPGGGLEIHPAAEAFPVLPEPLAEMTESIRLSGQMDPVTVYKGQILDGRRRDLACYALGLPLKCREITDLSGLEPLEWVVLRNLAAGTVRHLSDSQRALIAAELCVEIYQPEADERRRQGTLASESEKGLASAKAAKVVNVTTNRVRQALKVHARNWEPLKSAVWSGHIVISTAAQIATLEDQKDRKKALTAAERKDQATLRGILHKRTSFKDGLGKLVDTEVRPVFDTASTWNTHIGALRRVANWLIDSHDEPASRVLRRQLSPEAVTELLDKILVSQPWCQCPYCEQFSGATCQVCHGGGWLTENEYHGAVEAAASLLADSFHQEAPQEKRED